LPSFARLESRGRLSPRGLGWLLPALGTGVEHDGDWDLSREDLLFSGLELFAYCGLDFGQFGGFSLFVVEEKPYPLASGDVAGNFVAAYRPPGVGWIQDIRRSIHIPFRRVMRVIVVA